MQNVKTLHHEMCLEAYWYPVTNELPLTSGLGLLPYKLFIWIRGYQKVIGEEQMRKQYVQEETSE